MISFINISNEEPYKVFKEKYDVAEKANQKIIEAVAIASYCKINDEVHSRFVNLKFIKNKEFVFFTNYESPKAKQFESHSQITALIYWNSTNTQIRMKANISKLPSRFSDEHFKSRTPNKNALAISSMQSTKTDSYESVLVEYDNVLKNADLKKRPRYWGGYSFEPYYFEFWEGHQSRLNKRIVFEADDNEWNKYYLQP